MRFVIIIILSIILIAVLIQAYFILKERDQLKIKMDDLNSRFSALSKENSHIQSEIEYFSYPENLEKELRARFNYKKPGEKMIIITP
ncbi:MAG: hypothetical protein Q8N28_01165 [bacterium]|nr:hypothetical protein [bacterium]